MPRLCRLLHRELQKIACLATVHYQLTYCCCPAAIPNAGNAGRREHGRPARNLERSERAPVSYLEPTRPNTSPCHHPSGQRTMLCSALMCRERDGGMPCPSACLCTPLHLSMLLSWCDASSITPGSLRHAPCGLIVGVMRVPRNTRMKHAASRA